MRKYMFHFAFFILLIWLWHRASLSVSELVLPSPLVVGSVFVDGWTSGYFWPHVSRTLREIVYGLSIGTVFGLGLGIMMGESRMMRQFLQPYIIMSQAVPKLALAPLFILWFGFGMTSKVVITALVCFFPILENTLRAMHQVKREQIELFKMMQASRFQILMRLKIPNGIPHIMSGFRVSVILAVVGAVVGEFIGANEGLGALIIASQGTMNTPLMFAVLINLTLLGMMLYGLVHMIETYGLRRYLRRE